MLQFPRLLLVLELEGLLVIFTSASVSISVSGNGPEAHINSGDDVSFVCSVSRNFPGVVKYVWSKEDSGTMPPPNRLIGITQKVLIIKDTVALDSGTYRCQVTLSNGQSVSGTAKLLVMDAPEIRKYNSVRVPASANTVLECSGTGYLRIFWYKNDTLLNSNPRFATDTQVGEKLIINNVSLADAGIYTCKAKNSAGGHDEKTVSLVVETKPNVRIHPKDIRLLKGFDALFACNIFGIPVPAITWKKGRSRMQIETADPKYEIDSAANGQSALLITNVQKADEDVYMCVGLNTHGIAESREAHLTIGSLQPGAIGIEAHKSISLGSNDSIACSAKGFPSSFITWTFNGRDIRGIPFSNIFQRRNGELDINNAVYQYTGEYKCTIVIQYLSAKMTLVQTVYLTVKGPPDPPELKNVFVFHFPVNQTLYGRVWWNTPYHNGNSPVVGYKISWRAREVRHGYFPWSQKSFTFATKVLNYSSLVDLTNYIRYAPGNFTFDFTMKAVNAHGESIWSDAVTAYYVFKGIDGAPSANASRLPISKGKADDDKTIALGVGLPVGFTCLAILILVATFAHKNKGKRKNRRKFSNPREENVNKLDSAYASFHKSLSNSLERISYADEYASNGIGSYRQTKVTTIV